MLHLGFSNDKLLTKLPLTLQNISFQQLLPMLKTVTVGSKDGSFFTRAGFVDTSQTKNTKTNAEPSAQVVIIDADSTIDLNTGKVTPGAPDPNLVAARLNAEDWNFTLFRTHSYTANLYKYRIVFETDVPYTKEELAPTLEQIFSVLHASGLYLHNASENIRWAQAWYLPRRDVSSQDPFTFLEYTKGFPLNVKQPPPILAQVQTALAKKQASNQSNQLGNGIIRIFNSLHTISEELLARGDSIAGSDRFIYSKSTSGKPGITVFSDLMYSHHGDDPLADGEAHDAFDIHQISNNLSMTEVIQKLKTKEILDFISGCNDDEDVLKAINIGLDFSSPVTAGQVRREIKKRLGVNMGDLKAEAKEFKKAYEAIDSDGLDTHIDIVEDYLDAYETKPISYAGQLYNFENKIWIAKPVENFETVFAKRYKANNLCKRSNDYTALAKLLYTSCKTEDFFANAPKGIAVDNRFITINEDGTTHDQPLSANFKQRIHYDFAVDPAPPTLWLSVLDQSFDTQEEKDLLQEIFAATLFGLFPSFKKAALLKGVGDSGKSAVLSVLESFIPRELKSASPPAAWRNPERLGNIAGMALNSVGEMDAKAKMSGNEFKKVTGSDMCEGRLLYIGTFDFKNTAAHIFNANEYPPTSATDDAFFARWLILEFKHKIEVKDQIKEFADKVVKAEQAQILGWIIEGAQRLVQNQNFTIPHQHDVLITKWQSSVDTYKAFCSEQRHLTLVPNPTTIPLHDQVFYSTDSIYKLYLSWCKANTIKGILSQTRLIQKLRDDGIIYQNHNNTLSMLYHGVKLNVDFSYTNLVGLFDIDGIQALDYKREPR